MLIEFLKAERDMMRDIQRRNAVTSLAYAGFANFVVAHGTAFTGQPLPSAYAANRGRMKECFQNAVFATWAHPELTYVEGYAQSIIPVHHAWCVDPDGHVIEVTWPDDDAHAQREYFGVPFPHQLVIAAMAASGYYGVLDDYRNRFPLLQQPYTPEAALATLEAIIKGKKGSKRRARLSLRLA